MSYITPRGPWCDIVLNVHVPTEDKTDMKDSFSKELERVFDKFPKYHMKMLLGDFSAKVSREDIFKPTIRYENVHEISEDNGVRVVNIATYKNLTVRSTMFHSHIVTFLNLLEHLPMERLAIKLTIF
jgi:hypothetical protein